MLIYPFYIKDTEELVWTEIREKSVRVCDCYLFPKKEQVKQIVDEIYEAIPEEGYTISRSKRDMCGELYLHIVCARLGIFYNAAKDADLEYDKDPRWIVRFCSKMFSLLF